MELKAVFERLQKAEQSGMSADELRKLEEQAAEQGMRTMWKGVKLEVESVIRDTCEKVLSDSTLPKEKLHLRAVALGLMGEVRSNVNRGSLRGADLLIQAFLTIHKEGETHQEDFVRVETPASKQREASNATTQAPPPIPPRPEDTTTATRDAQQKEKEETLKAAYRACKQNFHSTSTRGRTDRYIATQTKVSGEVIHD